MAPPHELRGHRAPDLDLALEDQLDVDAGGGGQNHHVAQLVGDAAEEPRGGAAQHKAVGQRVAQRPGDGDPLGEVHRGGRHGDGRVLEVEGDRYPGLGRDGALRRLVGGEEEIAAMAVGAHRPPELPRVVAAAADGAALGVRESPELGDDLRVEARGQRQVRRIVGPGVQPQLHEPVGEASVAGLAVRPGTHPDDDVEAAVLRQLDEGAQIQVTVPAEDARGRLVGLPEHVGGDGIEAAGPGMPEHLGPPAARDAREVDLAGDREPGVPGPFEEAARHLDPIGDRVRLAQGQVVPSREAGRPQPEATFPPMIDGHVSPLGSCVSSNLAI